MKEKGKKNPQKTKTKKTKTKKERNGALGFVQLICKASLIFKWNLELALSIILKRIIRVKTCCSGVQMFKNMRLAILFDMFLNPSFKMTSFANIARTTASSSEFIY